jgi:nucleotide-binding universal stress UspA family protein
MILVTLDRSPFAEAVLEPVTALARLTAADIRLLTVVEPVLPLVEPPIGAPLVVDDELNQKLVEAARGYVERIAEQLRKEGMRVSTTVVTSPGAAHSIIGATAGDACDLVAIATHGERGLRRAVLGSVADKVIRGGSHPVLVLRPGPRA